LDIHWGGGSFGNALPLYDIDEKVDYQAAYAARHTVAVAIAVLAGPGLNGLLYLITRFAAPWWRLGGSPRRRT
jgi:hypothetical protein